MTVDTTQSILYVNGVQDVVGTTFAFTSSALQKAQIGQYKFTDGSMGQWFDGNIAAVRFWARTLTAAEVQRLYIADKPRYGGL